VVLFCFFGILKSKTTIHSFGVSYCMLQHMRVKALYQRAKREMVVVTGSSALANKVMDKLPVPLRGRAKEFTGIAFNGGNHLPISAFDGRKRHSSAVGGLQLTWQGKINRLYSHRETSLEYRKEEGPSSTSSKGQKAELVANQGPERRRRDHAAKRSVSYFGKKFCGARSIDNEGTETKTYSSMKKERISEEYEWDSRGWELKCSTDSLSNCTVVKALASDLTSDKKVVHSGNYWLRVFMSAGSWSPQASRLAGITTGGVSVRSALSLRYESVTSP
jgi:hypothetical protein